MKEAFIDYRPRAPGLAMLETVNEIIDEYQAQDLRMTLRQLYYQLVARGIIPNHAKEYKKLIDLMSKARKGGHVDWTSIEDRTRNLEVTPTWDSPAQILKSAAKQYQRDLWATQTYKIECWIEKEALSGVIGQACEKWQIPYLACKGYLSLSEMYEAGERLQRYRENDKTPIILYLGDHDPSGMNMTETSKQGLDLFSYSNIQVERIALNYDQVLEHNPPPDPAKQSDSRYTTYIQQYGSECWELDALDPVTLNNLIEKAVLTYIDTDAWTTALTIQNDEIQELEDIADKYND